jgi:hypothetical protein
VNDGETIVWFDAEEVVLCIGNYHAMLYASVEIEGSFLGGDTEGGRKNRD